MKTNQTIKNYGKSRCTDVHYYLGRLNIEYNFPYSKDDTDTLFRMVEALEGYSSADFSASFKKLDSMKTYGPINRSHIKKACAEAKVDRIRKEKLEEPPAPPPKRCPMPADFKARIAKSLS